MVLIHIIGEVRMIFTKERYLEIIDERLSVLCSNIRKRNGDLFTDVNKGAENFYVDLLNLIYVNKNNHLFIKDIMS